MVAVKEQVLRDVLDQADPGAADSQVVMMAGEEIKVEMLDDPTDESCHEDNTAEVADEDPYDPSTNLMLEVGEAGQVVVGVAVGDEDSDGSSVLVSVLCLL